MNPTLLSAVFSMKWNDPSTGTLLSTPLITMVSYSKVPDGITHVKMHAMIITAEIIAYV